MQTPTPNPTEGSQAQSADVPLQLSLEILILFTEALELRSGEQSQAEQETRKDLRKLGVLGRESSPPTQSRGQIPMGGVGSRFHVFSWEELTHEGGGLEALQ